MMACRGRCGHFSYWVEKQEAYPALSQLAFDVLSVPASSADCERMFSEVGDLLESRRLKMKLAVVTALQCIKSWRRQRGKKVQSSTPKADSEIDEMAALLDSQEDYVSTPPISINL